MSVDKNVDIDIREEARIIAERRQKWWIEGLSRDEGALATKNEANAFVEGYVQAATRFGAQKSYKERVAAEAKVTLPRDKAPSTFEQESDVDLFVAQMRSKGVPDSQGRVHKLTPARK